MERPAMQIKNKKIYKGLFIILTIIALFSFVPAENNTCLAQGLQKAASEMCSGSDCPIKDPADIFKILKKVVQYTYTIFFIVAVIFIIIAAFNFLTSQGNPEKIKSASTQIVWACVAIAIALISVGAAEIIQKFITA